MSRVDSSDSFPLVSIGMPAFNCEETLAVAIRSILNQTYENWELLVVENGSGEGTLEVARSFSDPRIRVSADNSHEGLVPRLNQAVAMSRGEYYARWTPMTWLIPGVLNVRSNTCSGIERSIWSVAAC